MPAPRDVEVAAGKPVAIEAVLDDELDGDAQHGFRGQTTVLVDDECSLQVIVEWNDPTAVDLKIFRGGLAFEVDENSFDDFGTVGTSVDFFVSVSSP